MVAEMNPPPERAFRGPGCTDECHIVRALIPGVFGRSDLLIHDPDSHEAYGRGTVDPLAARQTNVIGTGVLSVDVRRLEVSVQGIVVPLTPTELKIMVALARLGGGAIAVDELVEMIWGKAWDVDAGRKSGPNSLRTNMSRLRQKLGPAAELLRTMIGIGYRLEMIPIGAPAPDRAHSMGRLKLLGWSIRYERCVRCGKTDAPHWARGHCQRCRSNAGPPPRGARR